MARPIKRLVVLAGLALLLPLPAARGTEEVSDLLRRQTQEMLDAVAVGGATVWERYLDPKAAYTAEDGTVYTKSKLVEGIKPLPEGVSGTIRVIDFQATVHGNVAIANYVADEHEDYHGHELHCQYRNTDTWLQTPEGWRLIAAQALALRTDPPAVPLTDRQMDEYVGRYALTPSITYEIRRKGDGLEGQQVGRPAEELRAEAPDVLFVPGRPRYRRIFQRGPDDGITAFAERREAWDLGWKRLPPTPPPS